MQHLPACAAIIVLFATLPVSATNRYVALDGAHVSPFTSWATAATNISDALDDAVDGDRIIVSNGHYRLRETVDVRDGITVESLAGAGQTALDGGHGSFRCVKLWDPQAVLAGFTVTGGRDNHNEGGGIQIYHNGYVRDCIVTGNSARVAGGMHCYYGGIISNCIISGNTSDYSAGGVQLYYGGSVIWCRIEHNLSGDEAGGLWCFGGGLARNCTIIDNQSADHGGGVKCIYGGHIENCYVANNRSGNRGGGLYGSQAMVVNSTLVGNSANDTAGGMYLYSGTAVNSIVYYNTAPNYPDYLINYSAYGSYCCLPTTSSRADNTVTNPPQLAGRSNPHLLPGSLCIDAGSSAAAGPIDADIDREPRVLSIVDMGCDEFVPTGLTGSLHAAIAADALTALRNTPLMFEADTQGKVQLLIWEIETGGSPLRYTNMASVTHAWPAAGNYEVILRVSNLSRIMAATVTVGVVDELVYYASPLGAHQPPFTSWADAGTSVAAVVSAAASGAAVMLSNGVFHESAEIVVAKPLRIQSLGGPGATTIDAGGTHRCLKTGAEAVFISGCTFTNGRESSGNGGGLYLEQDDTVSNCIIAGCAAKNGGGAYLKDNSVIVDSLLVGNTGGWGGAVYCDTGGRLAQCTVRGNIANYYGGGIYLDSGGHVDSCFITDNRGGEGAGINANVAVVANSTITGNRSDSRGAGVDGGIYHNCIIYYNTTLGVSDNHRVYGSASFSNCCTWPMPGGSANIDLQPGLAGIRNPHLVLAAPCVDAGRNQYAPPGTDIDGEARIGNGTVDIGADEVWPNAMTGPLVAGIHARHTAAVVRAPFQLEAAIEGKCERYWWSLGDGTAATDLLQVVHAYATPGTKQVVLHASNKEDSVATTAMLYVATARTNYVSLAGSDTAPYDTWATAAHTLQDAIDAAPYAGGLVLVADGVYSQGGVTTNTHLNRIYVGKMLTVIATNPNPAATVIYGGTSVRCAFLDDDTTLIGFTLTNGHTIDYFRAEDGGGAFCRSRVLISNCVITRCYADYNGGGVYGMRGAFPRVMDCVLLRNTAVAEGGGAYGAHLYNCRVDANKAEYGTGGGVFLGSISNCMVRGNYAHKRGGGVGDADVFDSIIGDNECHDKDGRGGGVSIYDSTTHTIAGSVVYGNFSSNYGAGVYFDENTVMRFCTVTGNFTRGNGAGVCHSGVASSSFVYANSALLSGGGIYCTYGDVVDCTIASNTAAHSAGGVYFNGNRFTRCHVTGNTAGQHGGGVLCKRFKMVTTSWISRNAAMLDGGGVWCDYRATVRNSEIVGNVASNSGGGVYCATGSVESCTITANSAPSGGGIYCHVTGTFVNVIAYANTGGDTSDGGEVGNYLHCCTVPMMIGVGNISTNPQFMSAAAGDYRLAEGSPCVDVGTNQSWMINVGDLRHLPRIWDYIVDMGCHEQIPEPGAALLCLLACALGRTGAWWAATPRRGND